MSTCFYRVGHGPKPDWLTDDMLQGVSRGDYVIKTKSHGVITGNDYQMTAAERQRREKRLEKLHG